MQGKVCLITGATSGIGQAAALGLARLGAHVVLVGRDRARSEDTRKAIADATGSAALEVLTADLARQRDVRELARAFRAAHPRLDVLVHNAGLVQGHRTLTEDGLELTMAVNHLAPFLLTHLLMAELRASSQGRVISVASEAHRTSSGRFDFRAERPYIAWRAYGDSKLANILFARELARRLEGTRITANAMHPGVVATNFGASGGVLIGAGMRLLRPVLRTREQGADTVVWLASAPELEGVSGGYFKDRRARTPSRVAQDPALQRTLWAESARLTGVEA